MGEEQGLNLQEELESKEEEDMEEELSESEDELVQRRSRRLSRATKSSAKSKMHKMINEEKIPQHAFIKHKIVQAERAAEQ